MSKFKKLDNGDIESRAESDLSLQTLFNEYRLSIKEVATIAGEKLPNISFVFKNRSEDEILFASPNLKSLLQGDLVSPVEEMVKSYPDEKYEIMHLLAVFPGMLVNEDTNETIPFHAYGGLDVRTNEFVFTDEPKVEIRLDSQQQDEIMKALLEKLRDEIRIQQSLQNISL